MGALKPSDDDEAKRTNEIGMAIPLLEGCALAGRDVTADALLTQRKLATYLVARGAHYHFTVKANQPHLAEALATYFAQRGQPDYAEAPSLAHGRVEQRRIWTTTAINAYVAFPHVAQAWCIERLRLDKRTGHASTELAFGLTSRPPAEASPQQLLAINRGHWRIESVHYLIDWNYDEDRSRIRTGHGPENMTRLRRFALGLLAAFRKPGQSVAARMRQLARRPRQVLDYLRLSANSTRTTRVAR